MTRYLYGKLNTHTVHVSDPDNTYADPGGHIPINVCFSVEQADPEVGFFRDYVDVYSMSYVNPKIPYSVAERHEEAAVRQVQVELGLL